MPGRQPASPSVSAVPSAHGILRRDEGIHTHHGVVAIRQRRRTFVVEQVEPRRMFAVEALPVVGMDRAVRLERAFRSTYPTERFAIRLA